jgi:hypothetical protein
MAGPKVYYKETAEDVARREAIIAQKLRKGNCMSYEEAVTAGMYMPSVTSDDTFSADSIGHRMPQFNVEVMLSCLDDVYKTSRKVKKEMIKIYNEHDELSGEALDDFTDAYHAMREMYDNYHKLLDKHNHYVKQNLALFRCYDDTQCAPAQDDPRWQIMRNDGIGASEAENLHKRESKTLLRWIKEKAGVLPRLFNGNAATEQGHQMEPVVGKILDHKFQTKLFESTSLVHRKYPFIRASLDRYGYIYGVPCIIEIKSPVSRIPEKDSIPTGYDLQMHQQHDVSEIHAGMFADFKFTLYDTYKELIDAINGDKQTKPSRKKYFGAILKFPHSKRAFAYSPIDKPDQCQQWVKDKKEALRAMGYTTYENHDKWWVGEEFKTVVKIVYWRLTHMVLVPHPHNPSWAEENLDKYKAMWDRIMAYKNGYRDDDDRAHDEAEALFE